MYRKLSVCNYVLFPVALLCLGYQSRSPILQAQCYVMTANLDGETSLKTRHSASLTKQAKDVKQLVNMYGCIECENPNPKLDSFLGRLTMWSCKEGDEPEV